jgi:hypothetical protein
MDVLFEFYKSPRAHAINWPPYLLILLKRILESKYIVVIPSNVSMSVGGVQLSTDFVLLSEEGRNFLDELGIAEL